MAPWVEDNNAPNHRRSGTVDVLGFDESGFGEAWVPMFIRLDGGQLCCFDARRNLEGLEDEDDDDEEEEDKEEELEEEEAADPLAGS